MFCQIKMALIGKDYGRMYEKYKLQHFSSIPCKSTLYDLTTKTL